jgi:hypothetical protein
LVGKKLDKKYTETFYTRLNMDAQRRQMELNKNQEKK